MNERLKEQSRQDDVNIVNLIHSLTNERVPVVREGLKNFEGERILNYNGTPTKEFEEFLEEQKWVSEKGLMSKPLIQMEKKEVELSVHGFLDDSIFGKSHRTTTLLGYILNSKFYASDPTEPLRDNYTVDCVREIEHTISQKYQKLDEIHREIAILQAELNLFE